MAIKTESEDDDDDHDLITVEGGRFKIISSSKQAFGGEMQSLHEDMNNNSNRRVA